MALTTDHPVIPIQHLIVCAALAIREGMSEAEALRSITLYPAQILGIDERVGEHRIRKRCGFCGDRRRAFRCAQQSDRNVY